VSDLIHMRRAIERAAERLRAALSADAPTLAGSFLRERLIDRVVGYLAPALLGAGAAALGPAGVRTIGETHRLVYEEVVPVGPDLRVLARPAPKEES
jgi:diaminohydroxyphosphoribosylaminopyrimidine deaminase/5-amino-6-(5-phosphoribosylamino)uracil reductase